MNEIPGEDLNTLPIGAVVLDRHGVAAQIVRAHDRQGDTLLYYVGNPDPYDAGHEGKTGKWFDASQYGPFRVLFDPTLTDSGARRAHEVDDAEA